VSDRGPKIFAFVSVQRFRVNGYVVARQMIGIVAKGAEAVGQGRKRCQALGEAHVPNAVSRVHSDGSPNGTEINLISQPR
jgi:hypothetical protein